MFAGVCPYGILISKKQPSVKIIAVEINPVAFEYMKENIRLNRVSDRIIPILGDVKKESKRWYGKCDRVIMPLPKDAEKFLKEAFLCLKPEGGIIHFYHVNSENDFFSEPIKLLKKHAKKLNRKIRVLKKRKVLSYGPRKWKVCVDCLVK
jgi:tRNA (guanine37-N1)-methyltransferase